MSLFPSPGVREGMKKDPEFGWGEGLPLWRLLSNPCANTGLASSALHDLRQNATPLSLGLLISEMGVITLTYRAALQTTGDHTQVGPAQHGCPLGAHQDPFPVCCAGDERATTLGQSC